MLNKELLMRNGAVAKKIREHLSMEGSMDDWLNIHKFDKL